MKAVLYTQDLEPITVIDLDPYLFDMLKRGERVRLHIPVDFSRDLEFLTALPIVTLTGEILRRDEAEGLMVFVDNEVYALKLRAAFLPGQYGAVQDEQREQFARGFLDALQRVGK